MKMLTLLVVVLAAAFTPAQEAPSNQELARRIDLLSEQIEQQALIEIGATATHSLASTHGLGPAASKVYGLDQGVSIGGYGEMLYTSPTNGNDGAMWDFYRAITYIGYRFDENWLFNAEIEIEHIDEIALEFGYLDWLGTDEWNVRIGHVLAPLGWINEMHEPTTFLGANRPLTEKYILPSTWHENAVGFFGDVGDFRYRAYAMTSFDAAGFDLANSGLRGGRQKGSKAKADDIALAGRLDYRGLANHTIGLSFYQGNSGQDSSIDHEVFVWDAHAEYKRGPVQVRALWAEASVRDANSLPIPSSIEDVAGRWLEFGYDLHAGKESALIPFARIERLELENVETRKTFGIFWQPRAGVVFKADYSPDADIIEVAMGFNF
jgi:hypothetical protein